MAREQVSPSLPDFLSPKFTFSGPAAKDQRVLNTWPTPRDY